MYSKRFSKKKLLVFHSKDAVQHLERQPNQSFYVESLVLDDINKPNVYVLLQEIKQQIVNNPKNEKIEPSSISSSIDNILNFK